MSENERLRKELEALVYALDFEDLSDSVDLNGAKSALAAEPEVSTDRLNALERDNADLNAELTETIAAVSDLMDENKRFRDVLEMDDGENPETLRQELMELTEVTIRIREENADLKTQVAEETHECNKLLDERRNLQTEVGDLRLQLAEAYERVATMADEWAQTEIAAGTDKGYAQIMEVFAEEVRSLIPPKEADHDNSNS